MPEGHTIHRLARDHSKLLVGGQVAVSSPQGRFAGDAALVDGAELHRIEAYGKHLFHYWSTGHVGHIHLGLFGRFRVALGDSDPDPVGEVRMRLQSDRATVDLSGPTACSISTIEERDAIVARLGPDPLRRDAIPQLAIARMAASRQPLGALLLDQRVLAGVGNVYRAEALFINGIHPQRAGIESTEKQLQDLWDTVTGMLRQGVRDNRIITLDRKEFAVPRRPLRRGEATYVYHRDLCLHCGSAIQTVELGGRPCYYCPTCQPN
ncbi:MAG: DNA-formamidopyrimidine glycosylase family protein [Ilumatobacteraceae bacterium]